MLHHKFCFHLVLFVTMMYTFDHIYAAPFGIEAIFGWIPSYFEKPSALEPNNTDELARKFSRRHVEMLNLFQEVGSIGVCNGCSEICRAGVIDRNVLLDVTRCGGECFGEFQPSFITSKYKDGGSTYGIMFYYHPYTMFENWTRWDWMVFNTVDLPCVRGDYELLGLVEGYYYLHWHNLEYSLFY